VHTEEWYAAGGFDDPDGVVMLPPAIAAQVEDYGRVEGPKRGATPAGATEGIPMKTAFVTFNVL
jgi:hypothetical protein